jgi:aspartate aminotransferase
MKAEGLDVCSFGAGEPDMDTPDHIKAAAQAALEMGFTKYTPSSGIPELRDAIAEKLANDNKVNYKSSQIIVSNGAKHSCFNAMLAVCQPGDEVIIPAPYWLSYPEMARVVGADPVIVQTKQENGWKMTPDDFQDAMTPRTKMVIINSPATRREPSTPARRSRRWSRSPLAKISSSFPTKFTRSSLMTARSTSASHSVSKEAYDLTITVNGFSKAYSMTGWRLGYLAAPESIAKAIDAIQSHSTSNPCSFAQKGGLAALEGRSDLRGGHARRVRTCVAATW